MPQQAIVGGKFEEEKKTEKIDKNLEAKSKHQEGTQRAKSVGWTDFMWAFTIITRSRQMNIRGGKISRLGRFQNLL